MPINELPSSAFVTTPYTWSAAATFASPGTYYVTSTYTEVPITIAKKEGLSVSGDSIIESLFTLNPTVRKKYKGDKQKFAEALVAAAKLTEGQGALDDLTALGLTE